MVVDGIGERKRKRGQVWYDFISKAFSSSSRRRRAPYLVLIFLPFPFFYIRFAYRLSTSPWYCSDDDIFLVLLAGRVCVCVCVIVTRHTTTHTSNGRTTTTTTTMTTVCVLIRLGNSIPFSSSSLPLEPPLGRRRPAQHLKMRLVYIYTTYINVLVPSRSLLPAISYRSSTDVATLCNRPPPRRTARDAVKFFFILFYFIIKFIAK